MGAVKNFYHDEICAAEYDDCAPPEFQAEVLRGQVCDDINRRFWRARQRLFAAFEDRKERVQRDHDKMSAEQFLETYSAWRFR